MHEPRWFAVHTLPHREFGAAEQLTAQGFEVFLPVHFKTIRHARQYRSAKAAFFPRYLFVRLDLSIDRWRSVNGTFGVASLVMGGDRPAPIPAGVVEGLSQLIDSSGVISVIPLLRYGQRVRIVAGPFADMIGELTGFDARERVRVLLDIMGGRVSVHVSGQTLSAA
jgi:transcription antitermination factor NusG